MTATIIAQNSGRKLMATAIAQRAENILNEYSSAEGGPQQVR
ncbi:hypothetical protein [Aurantiacibacter sp. MUD61]|nr:hypothetical protein [Aurantiacibacter sp. MUD61]